MKKIILSLPFLFLGVIMNAQNDACKFVGEISIISVEKGAFLVCTKSANPAACSIAFAAHNCGDNPACEGIVKDLVEKGCKYTVEVVGNKIKIIGKSTEENVYELKRTWEALNSVEGILWIEKKLLNF
ncbi:hypothetical protein [Neolewinella persica]|uniref:hypothetical protein n=1 Tax=Neolewinella persica TaxID=70998 RepID=UPI000361173B|nr:hypothetical protein [Neolewinella persica]